MQNKIPKKYNILIYEAYEDLLPKGLTKAEIAMELNERWGTEFPESSMRGRYEKMKLSGSMGLDDYEFQRKQFLLSSGQVRLKETQKSLVRQRSIIDSQVKEYMDRSVVAKVIEDIYNMEMEHLTELTVKMPYNHDGFPIFAYGDPHLGYTYKGSQFEYDIDICRQRIKDIFDGIIRRTLANGFTHIVVADLGDDIEGSALRVGQLIRITETMSKQALLYTNLLVEMLKYLSASLPNTQITFAHVSEDNHSQMRLYNTKRDELDENLQLLITNGIRNMVDTAHEFGGLLNISYVSADEIVLSFGAEKPFNIVMAHGHQYGRADDILKNVEQRHGINVHAYISAHWHQFSMKYRNVKDNGQQVLIFLPSVIGDTDFSEHLFLSCYPAYLQINVDLTDRVLNSELIRLT